VGRLQILAWPVHVSLSQEEPKGDTGKPQRDPRKPEMSGGRGIMGQHGIIMAPLETSGGPRWAFPAGVGSWHRFRHTAPTWSILQSHIWWRAATTADLHAFSFEGQLRIGRGFARVAEVPPSLIRRFRKSLCGCGLTHGNKSKGGMAQRQRV
jgi:hypothetical protein